MSAHVHYAMDAALSQLTVHAFASGLASVVAHNPKFAIREFAGDAEFVPDPLREAAIRMRMKVSSLELMDEVSEYDRVEINRVMFEEVLQKSRFPEISFTSSEIAAQQMSENLYAATVSGDLTLHGVTSRLGFAAQVVIGEDTLRGYGSFVVKRGEYGIVTASVAGGTLKMKDELKIAFFIVAKKQG